MQLFADGPRQRVRARLQTARNAAAGSARRTSCAGCRRRRLCGNVELLAAGQAFYCFAECWPYQLGVVHGQLASARLVRELVTRELDRVYDPAAVGLRGWPVYRCDGCGDVAPEFTSAPELLELGWVELGRDAHLCPGCQPRRIPLQIAA